MDDTRPRPDYRAVVGMRVGPSLTGRMVLGLILMTLGVLWMLDNLGIVESGPILRWWPVVLVAVGVAHLTGLAGRRRVVSGALFTVVGAWLLAEHLGYVEVSVWELWPLALVAIGIGMLTRSAVRPRDGAVVHDVSDSDQLRSFAFMSGVTRQVASQEFRGGDVTAVMGGVKLDLRPARPVPQGAVIDVMVCWGGVELTVPDHWKIVNQATVLMGGLEDHSRVPPAESRDTLILRGLVIMGGVEIKN